MACYHDPSFLRVSIVNNATLLYRVISPAMLVQLGHVSSQAFRPRSSDRKLLSVYDGDLITPPDACRQYTRADDNQPVGVLAVSHAECSAQSLSVRADPAPFHAHALIDFTPFGSNEIRRKSVSLRDVAVARGWLPC